MTFYTAEIFSPGINFSEVSAPEQAPIRQAKPLIEWRSPVMLTMAAAVALVGIVTVSPSSLTSATTRSAVVVRQGHVAKPSDLSVERATRSAARVDMPPLHRSAAERFSRLFRSVPLNDIERLPDPDYGL